ncbi:MAG: hypothetical protein AAF891_05420 [Pseudomonadota bacterium]
MFIKSFAAAAVACVALSGQAFAWGDMYMGKSTSPSTVAIHPYHGPNYCPIGLQPVVVNGVICCGQPNSNMSYQQMMAHPMPRKAARAHTHRKTHTHAKRHTHTYRHSH